MGAFVKKEVRVIVRGGILVLFLPGGGSVGCLAEGANFMQHFGGPDVFLSEKAVRACQLQLLF